MWIHSRVTILPHHWLHIYKLQILDPLEGYNIASLLAYTYKVQVLVLLSQ